MTVVQSSRKKQRRRWTHAFGLSLYLSMIVLVLFMLYAPQSVYNQQQQWEQQQQQHGRMMPHNDPIRSRLLGYKTVNTTDLVSAKQPVTTTTTATTTTARKTMPLVVVSDTTPTASPPPTHTTTPTRMHETGTWRYCQTPNQTWMDQQMALFRPGFHNGTTVVSCRVIHYKLPLWGSSSPSSRLHLEPNLQRLRNPDVRSFELFVGVLSAYPSKRQSIRQTWAQNVSRVCFVVAGPWTKALADEFEQHGDILWLDRPERYEDLLYKTGALFAIVHQHYYRQEGLTHVIKTDDDTYWNMPELYKDLLVRGGDAYKKDFYGSCDVVRSYPVRPYQLQHAAGRTEFTEKFVINKTVYPERFFPPYCQGAGFVLRAQHLDCLAQHVPDLRFHPFEDVAVGLLADRCGMTPTHRSNRVEQKWKIDKNHINMTGRILQHPVREPHDMHQRHGTVLFRPYQRNLPVWTAAPQPQQQPQQQTSTKK